jgi:hypothetical protein
VTPAEAEKIIDEQGIGSLIITLYPASDPKRIALLRLLNACERANNAVDWCGQFLSRFLVEPNEYLADEVLCEEAERLAGNLQVLAQELRKSLPVLSKRGDDRVEGRPVRLRGEGQAPDREGEKRPEGRDPELDDWRDVPF